MPTTRSASKQTNLEDFADTKTTTTSSTTEKPTKKTKQPLKRKSTDASTEEKSNPTKRSRTTKAEPGNSADEAQDNKKPAKASSKKAAPPKADLKPSATPENDSSSIMINRAPVLHLYSACVTHLLYPDLSWDSCISAGSAISALCAMAKGRSIGVLSEPQEKSPDAKKATEKKKKELEELDVMQFKLRTNKDGLVVLGKDTKKADEAGLKRKYGGDSEYEGVKQCFEEALGTWKGDEQELSAKAFGFYEKFRPNVAKGGRGWGRKGELNFETIRDVVGKA